jgi:antitoxin YefM
MLIAMKTVPLTEAKDKLSALVDEADTTHEIIQITRHGRVAAVIMSADDLDSLNETLHALRTPGVADELAQADADYAAGNTVSGEELRERYGLT